MKSVESDSDDEIRIGVSMCLLGENVRYDGGHKRSAYITETLAAYFKFVPVCPEVEIGLGIPRETLRLVRVGDAVRMIAPSSGSDHTVAMSRYASAKVRALRAESLSGYILKKGSPSCGMERVRTYTPTGMPSTSGRGLFAHALLEAFPLLPCEEEGRLNDPALRESFIERVFAYHRVVKLFRGRWRMADLVQFQAREKLLLMAHSPSAQRQLGRLVASSAELERRELAATYTSEFLTALARPAVRRRHVNVLQHMMGYFKRELGSGEKAELLELIDDFGRGLVPLIVPVTLIRHYVRRYDVGYLAGQSYLEPHPKELMLRNHA